MQINKTTNTNFTGTFILKPKHLETKEAIPNIIKQGRQLFYNIENEGDVVLVTRDKYDTKVKDFIEAQKIDFTYYPEISTQSGLDDEVPSLLKKLLNIKNNCVINNLKILNKFLSNTNIQLNKQGEYFEQALNTLRLSVENPKIEIDSKGMFVIRDNTKQRTIKSTGFRGGSAYIYIVPDSINQESKRFLLGQNGKQIIKEFNTPTDMRNFNKKFKKLIELDN